MLEVKDQASGQGGGIGKHNLTPHTTKQKIKLNYKTTTTQNRQRIELYGSLTIKELKQSPSSRQVGGTETQNTEMWNGQYHTYMWWIKIGRHTSGVRDPRPTPDHPAHGSSDGKISPHNFWL
ncbi:hypothetical protein HJG60_010500 [Phyllostomus discolor]|uniref:Uncharacterized protein n=1 Tax=Phyllostomus discolor TaxID=89673 RepID=A0A834ALF2_9CHIR|nr:hypothetical protein HJG60_010500 [Phyllostomus discolor]